MGCSCNGGSVCGAELHKEKKTNWEPLLSFAMLVAGAVLNHFEWFSPAGSRLLWYAAAYLPVGLPVLREAAKSMRKGEYFNEFTLMGIATIGAFAIGEYPEGVAVMLFYSIGEAFQERAVADAKRDIKALLDVRPQTASVWRSGKWETIHPGQVRTGETIEVKAGGRVPLDGSLLNEEAAFNTSALTGESRPRHIRKGGEVLAGMISTDRNVQVVVGKPYGESALARILALVQEANERKAPAELFIRRFARIYTPVVAVLAVLIVLLPFLYSLAVPSFGFMLKEWVYRSLVFLVISCPCALVVSIPLGYFGGIGAASRAGILFKGGNYLDAVTKLNTVVFDKTGTLTKGSFDVQQVVSTSLSEAELLQYAASAEAQSTHPVARAIAEYAARKGISLLPATETKEIAGYGLQACIAGKEVLTGSTRLLARFGIPYPAEVDESPETLVACAISGRYAGYLLLSDTLKEDARRAIDELKDLKINNIEILSGDKQGIVSSLGQRLEVAHAYGELLPEGKVSHMKRLKANPANRIAFVGDGINDAPVLAMSHVGFAMGGLGSDAAIETADVVIQSDRPSKVGVAIRIGRATQHIVWQNISLAFTVKLTVLVLAALGVSSLWEAVFADVGVALLAILNAIRIQKKKF